MSFLTTAAVVGAGATAYGVINQATSKGPSAPPPRDLGQELGSLAGQFPDLASMLTGGTGNFNTSATQGLSQLSQGSLNTQAYAQARPDLVANFNSDPGYAQMYGSLENYLNADFQANEPNKAQYLTGGLPQVAAGLNTANRASNLNDVANLAGQYQGIIQGANQPYYDQLAQFTQAANAPVGMNPAQQAALAQAQQGFGTFSTNGLMSSVADSNPLLDALNQRAMSQMGPSEIQAQQNAIAKQLLADGGNLSASDLRNVQQASRGGFAARGLGGTNASVVDEVLQTDAAQRARLLQNLGIAQSVQNQGLSEQNLQQQFGLNVGSQNFGYDQLGLQSQLANQNFGLNAFNANLGAQTAQQNALQGLAGLSESQRQSQLAAMQAATSAQAQGRIDPYAAILGGTNDQLGALLGLYGSNQSQQSNLLSSLLGYGQDLSNTNYNAQAAANIAGSNRRTGLNSSLIGAGTNLLGSYLGAQTPK